MIEKIWRAIGGDVARIFPRAASSFATVDDQIMIYILAVSAFFSLGIFFALGYFALKYRRRTGNEIAREVSVSYTLEIVWAVFPLALVLVAYFWGAKSYLDQMTPRMNAENILVVGKQWMWKVEHENGVSEINELHVPIGKDVNLIMISEDVIHSFYIPDFRVKHDVLPGRYTRLWFRAESSGEFPLLCSEYCGSDHADMIGSVKAMTPADYEKWLLEAKGKPNVRSSSSEKGHRVFVSHGCISCHNDSSINRLAPNLHGRFAKGDEEFIRNSILRPSASVRAGFRDVMPTYAGAIKESEIYDLINYLTASRPPKENVND